MNAAMRLTKPVTIDPASYTASVVMPCFNEIHTIDEAIRRVLAADIPNIELIVVDDGSTDGTRERLQNDLADKINHLILHEENQGKGAALRNGVAAATGEIVIWQDADLEYTPQEYPKLVEPILEHGADVVYGSRFAGGQSHRVVYYWHMVANRILTLFSNMMTNINLSDMETGYKVFRREVIQSIRLRENRFGIEPEVTARLARKRVVFYEVGISYHGRTYQEGKKIGWKDAVRAVYAIIRHSIFP